MADLHKSQAKKGAASTDALGEKHGFEFGGPYVVGLFSVVLPILCYAFAFLCNDVTGCPAPSLLSPSKLFSPETVMGAQTRSGWQSGLDTLKHETGWPGLAGLINVESILGTVAWYGLSLVLNTVLPGQEVQGTELSTGGKLTYRFNAFYSAATILAVCAAGTFVQGPDFAVWSFINRNYIQLLTCNIIFSYALSTFVYLKSFSVKPDNKEQRELAAGGHSGNMIYDWFIGRELNPRVDLPFFGSIDIKAFMELRPGMLGWMMLDLAFIAKQYKSYGYVTDSILIVTAAQSIYILDALWMEPAILTTIDITTDGFGFMLAFGDLVWLPWTYSLQARYLSVHPVMLGPAYVAGILGIYAVGYSIFRGTNNQKNRFRTNPDDPRVQHLDYITTANGSRLLTSGWWGKARHINYLGDWTMSWAYCLPTLAAGYKLTPSVAYPGTRLVSQDGISGYAIPVTYFFMLYFAILLVHRERRDELKCRRKYGKDWEKYCSIVKSRIVPGVY